MHEPTTQWINADPPILLGLTSREILIVGVMCIVAWSVVSTFLIFQLGWSFLLILLFAPVGATASFFAIGVWLRKQKRDRPDHYFIHTWQIRMRQCLGIEGDVIHRGGWWSVGRRSGRRSALR